MVNDSGIHVKKKSSWFTEAVSALYVVLHYSIPLGFETENPWDQGGCGFFPPNQD